MTIFFLDKIQVLLRNYTQRARKYLFEPRYHFNRFQFNSLGLFFISIGLIAGVYLATSQIIGLIYADSHPSKTWTFSTANAAQFTYDSSLIQVNDTGAHPTGGVNGANRLTNPSFTSNNTSWSTAIVAPAGWAEVPGNSTYSTSNFLVMQYEAKYDCNGDGDGDTAAVCSAPTDSAGVDYRDLSTFTTSKVVSTANGAPIVDITHEQAVNACPAGYHLITNSEWMTIARNVDDVTANWANGVKGSTRASGGGLFQGNTGDNAATSYNASTDPDYGTSRNTKARLYLSNGAEIWDLSGNVWDLIRRDTSDTLIQQNQQPTLSISGDNNANTGTWGEFSEITGYGSLSSDFIKPLNNYLSGHGAGRIWTFGDGESATTLYSIIRGGDWTTIDDYSGVYSLHVAMPPNVAYGNTGYRCASDPVSISQTYGASSGRVGGGNTVVQGASVDGKIYQSVNVGDTSTYNFTAYVYDGTTGNVGGTVTSSIAQLYYNGAVIPTTYTNTGAGWWKLSGTLTGANASREYGVLVKVGKTVKVDDFTLSKQATYSVYNTTAYSDTPVNNWASFCEGTLSGSLCSPNATYSGDAAIKYQVCTDDGSTCESSSLWKYWNGSSWITSSNTTTDVNTAAQITDEAMQALSVTSQKISFKAIFTFGGTDVPNLPNVTVVYVKDTVAPETQAANVKFKYSASGSTVYTNDDDNPLWANSLAPYFSWDDGVDELDGSGIMGYCLYLGHDIDAAPNQAGVSELEPNGSYLGTSPVSTTGTNPLCQFIIATHSIDFANTSYRGTSWLPSSTEKYYLKVWAVDNAGNVQVNNPARFTFLFDNTAPTNVAYISCASGNFSDITSMNFSWPTTGSIASSDNTSGLLGWQYQIGSSSGTWAGTEINSTLGVNYIPVGASSYTLTVEQDQDSINTGNNVVYFRTIDNAGVPSSDGSVRTCNLSFGGAAPTFGGTDVVTVTPSSADTNYFGLSWPAATPDPDRTIVKYYYMINTLPPLSLATLQGNPATYFDNGTSRAVTTAALPNVNKLSNDVYVVAIDDHNNYSSSNFIHGTFDLNSTNPDNVSDLVASDSSIKLQSKWNVALVWAAPVYQGAGDLTYLVFRSLNGNDFSQVGTTTGLSYIDNTPNSALYFYKIYTKDGAESTSSGTNAVFIKPTGKWTSPAALITEPFIESVTTKKATITWSTDRTSDSKVAYGTKSGNYNDVEPSTSAQVTSHSIGLSGLEAQTKYFYVVKWTDEDGNTGTSSEQTFTTVPAPVVKNVSVKNISLYSGIIQFTAKGASGARIYYGKTTNFGGLKEITTSSSEGKYLAELTGLDDGTKYYYKINTFDAEGVEYDGTILDFSTLPRPLISGVKIQQVANTAQSTVLVSWQSNTEISSIVTYYAEGKIAESKDAVDIKLIKGEHKIIIRGLLPQKSYTLIVKGTDKIGNEAISDSLRFTTATDTRPPQVSELVVEGVAVSVSGSSNRKSSAQLIITWNTDEPATSQVEFGEGTGDFYSSKVQEDSNLTLNHLVIISSLTPSKVYHLRVISKDEAGNITKSTDTVTITPKATESALNLVVTNLQQAFGFLGGLKK